MYVSQKGCTGEKNALLCFMTPRASVNSLVFNPSVRLLFFETTCIYKDTSSKMLIHVRNELSV